MYSINIVIESNLNIYNGKIISFLNKNNKEKSFSTISPHYGGWVGRAKANCNEENDLNGGMASSCLQVYRNEIKLGLSIAKQ